MVAKLDSYLPRDSADQIRELAAEIDARVSAFIRGQSAVCLILAVFYAAGLSLAGLQYGLLVGSLTGLASFIPIFGWTLAPSLRQYWRLANSGPIFGKSGSSSGSCSPVRRLIRNF